MSHPTVIPCVGAIVHDDRRRLLVVRRGHEPGTGRWSVPGGRVEPGESEEAAVVRELVEETGVRGEVVRGVGRVRRPAPGGAVFGIHDFLMRPVPAGAADPVPGDDADDARWVTLGQLESLPLVDGLFEALSTWSVLPD